MAQDPSPPGRPGASLLWLAITVDTAQGSTATGHIHALPAGSHAIHGFKAYTAASRHERTTWIVVDEASERRHLAGRAIIGQRPDIGEPECGAKSAKISAVSRKRPSALEMLHPVTETPRQLQRRIVRHGVSA